MGEAYTVVCAGGEEIALPRHVASEFDYFQALQRCGMQEEENMRIHRRDNTSAVIGYLVRMMEAYASFKQDAEGRPKEFEVEHRRHTTELFASIAKDYGKPLLERLLSETKFRKWVRARSTRMVCKARLEGAMPERIPRPVYTELNGVLDEFCMPKLFRSLTEERLDDDGVWQFQMRNLNQWIEPKLPGNMEHAIIHRQLAYQRPR